LGALEELDDERGSAAHADEFIGGIDGVGKAGDGETDAFFGEELQAAQFIARAGDGDAVVEGEDAHHFELSYDGISIGGVLDGDARDDGIGMQFFALKVDAWLAGGDVHVAAQVIDDADLVAAGLGGLDESIGAVESGIAREDDEIHEEGGVGDG